MRMGTKPSVNSVIHSIGPLADRFKMIRSSGDSLKPMALSPSPRRLRHQVRWAPALMTRSDGAAKDPASLERYGLL